MNSKLKYKEAVADLNTDGNCATTDIDKANVLSNFFKKVFTEEDCNSIPSIPNKLVDSTLEDIVFTQKEVEDLLKDIKTSKSPGPDRIHPRVLQECAQELSLPLFILFKKSINQGILPTDWKLASITPVYKNKGSKHDSTNYRPISLTSVVCKILEKIIRKNIIYHMKINHLFASDQHGFMDGRSCSTNLLTYLDKITQFLDDKESVDIIYMDLQKAFDTVPHKRLLEKLKSYGIGGNILKWIESFLMGRQQQVIVNKTSSSKENMISGVPQGSVLGPILFVLYVNDLPHYVTSQIKIFADDTKIFRKIGNTSDCETLQKDLSNLEKWACDWQMRYHPQKCEVLRVGSGHPEFTYQMNNDGTTVNLEEVNSVKDLGVYVDSELDFSKHCNEMIKKANRILATIRRTFHHLDASNMTPLYKSLVRPYLEYGVEAWSPTTKRDIRLLESIQRRATKLIPSLSHLSYQERLESLKLPSLVYRRHRGDMIQAFKFINNIWDIEETILEPSDQTRTRGHPKKLFKDRWNTSVRGNFFSNRVVNLWNSLPENVVNAKDVKNFKIELDNCWKPKSWLYDFESDL